MSRQAIGKACRRTPRHGRRSTRHVGAGRSTAPWSAPWARSAKRSGERSTAIVDLLFVKANHGGEGCVVNGLKRVKGLGIHAAIDKCQNILALHVWPGSTADARAAHELLRSVKAAHPNITAVLGDKAYRGKPLQELASELGMSVDASSPSLPKGATFEAMPVR